MQPAEIERLPVERLDPALVAVLQPRVERLGYLGEFFRCAGHRPRALLAFIGFTDALVGRYVAHALFVNTLELASPVASMFAGSAAEVGGT